MTGQIPCLVGGAHRAGKSALAKQLLKTDGIPWLPTDALRSVLRPVLPELDGVDQDPVDAERLTDLMYPHIEQAAEVCAEEAERFLIEGFDLAPSYPAERTPGPASALTPSRVSIPPPHWSCRCTAAPLFFSGADRTSMPPEVDQLLKH